MTQTLDSTLNASDFSWARLNAEEKAIIRKDTEFMNEIKSISSKYGGSLKMLIQFKDKNDEIAYNFYATIDEKNILKITPLPIDESPAEVNMIIKVNFEKLYDLLYTIEKNLIGDEIESPTWNEKRNLFSMMQGTVNKMGVSLKINSLINSLEVSPSQSEADAKNIFKKFVLRIIATEYDDKEMVISDIEKSLWG